MKRTLLRFENIRQIVGTDELSVVLLTDLEQRRTLSVVCDHDMTKQMMMRLNGKREVCRTLLPEVLVKLLPSTYEMMIVGIYDGQYQVMLMDTQSGESQRIRISDAILLSLISKVPLYIEDRLMERQSVPFDEHASGVSIPINTMDTARLKLALKSAVEDENYELASQLRDEIKRRRECKKNVTFMCLMLQNNMNCPKRKRFMQCVCSVCKLAMPLSSSMVRASSIALL